MTKRETSFWGSKSQPDISESLVSEALALSADILIYSDLNGEISDIMVNPESENLGCLDHWIGRNIRDFTNEESIPKIEQHLSEVANSDLGEFRVTEINHSDNVNWSFPVRYTILNDPETQMLLFVGKDLAPVAMVQQDLVRTQLALEADYESSRDYETRYRAILESVEYPLLMINVDSNKIEDLNVLAAEHLGEAIEVLRGADFLSRFETNTNLRNLGAFVDKGGSGSHPTEWQMEVKSNGRQLGLSVTALRSAGTRYALCRLEAEKSSPSPDTVLADGLKTLFESGVDAIIFTNSSGIILSCNNSFLDLCDATSSTDVVNRPIADFLSRGSIDQKMLIEGVARSGQVRSYNTKVITNYRSSLSVNLSANKVGGPKGGYCFVIRTQRPTDGIQGSDASVPVNSNQNISKLVGASPLKEIVAGTADVIERICIETAIEMTGNNRVAAAEMLGLSRQSLYVKLRKYDLLSKSSDD